MRGSSGARRLVWLAGAALCAAAFACGPDFIHTNPYDPAVPVSVVLQGPDTIFNLAEVASYTAKTTPSFPDSAISFATSDTITFTPAGPGNFESSAPPLWPLTRQVSVFAFVGLTDTTIRVNIGGVDYTIQTKIPRHTGFKNVILTQRVTRISLRCPDTHACDPLTVGGTWQVWSDAFDSHGLRVYAFTSATTNPLTGTPLVTFSSRDSTIASVSPVGIRAATVTANKTGTTWIVATRGTLLDSLQLTVH